MGLANWPLSNVTGFLRALLKNFEKSLKGRPLKEHFPYSIIKVLGKHGLEGFFTKLRPLGLKRIGSSTLAQAQWLKHKARFTCHEPHTGCASSWHIRRGYCCDHTDRRTPPSAPWITWCLCERSHRPTVLKRDAST